MNLLVFNVVIEVGWVGKYGKGFVVVVDMVCVFVEVLDKSVVDIVK